MISQVSLSVIEKELTRFRLPIAGLARNLSLEYPMKNKEAAHLTIAIEESDINSDIWSAHVVAVIWRKFDTRTSLRQTRIKARTPKELKQKIAKWVYNV